MWSTEVVSATASEGFCFFCPSADFDNERNKSPRRTRPHRSCCASVDRHTDAVFYCWKLVITDDNVRRRQRMAACWLKWIRGVSFLIHWMWNCGDSPGKISGPWRHWGSNDSRGHDHFGFWSVLDDCDPVVNIDSVWSCDTVVRTAGKVTVGLASHWPCVADFSGISNYGLTAWKGRWAPLLHSWWGTAPLPLQEQETHKCRDPTRSSYSTNEPRVCIVAAHSVRSLAVSHYWRPTWM